MARTKKTVEEEVNIGSEQVTAPVDTVFDDMSKPVRICNPNLKGRKLYLLDGSIGKFDVEGVLEMSADNAQQLLKVPGFTLIP
jgi:hypothetical protein